LPVADVIDLTWWTKLAFVFFKFTSRDPGRYLCGTQESRLVWALFVRPVILRAQDQALALSLTTKTRRSVGEALEKSL
jgi:hypothetical protein